MRGLRAKAPVPGESTVVVLSRARIVGIRKELVDGAFRTSRSGSSSQYTATSRLRFCQFQSPPRHLRLAGQPRLFSSSSTRPHQIALHVWHVRRAGIERGGR
jgi:hypothetical protein